MPKNAVHRKRINCKSVVICDYYLYRHVRLDKNVPFYIGVGTKKDTAFASYRREYARAFNRLDRNFLWKRIYNSTDIEIEILYESNDYLDILDREKYFIALYKRILDGGSLANLTDGGEVFSERCREGSRKRGYETFGGNHPSALLSELDVLDIIESFNNGIKPIQLWRKYPKVCRHAIYNILKKKTWKHLSYLIKDEAYVLLYDKNSFHYSKKVINLETDEIFPSVASLCRTLGKPESTVRNWLKGNKSKYKFLN